MTTHRTLSLALLSLMTWAALSGRPAQAQVPPSPAEAAAYRGLHAAAWAGDLPRLQQLVSTTGQAGLNVRDPYGRTPLHVATYARQRAAIRALAQAGADLNLLERDR
jgi:ankyrin repeat protein